MQDDAKILGENDLGCSHSRSNALPNFNFKILVTPCAQYLYKILAFWSNLSSQIFKSTKHHGVTEWVSALCCFSFREVSIGQYTKMCTSSLIFFQLHYFRWQIFEENIWSLSLSLSLYIWPLESWTIIAIIRFNSILTMIGGKYRSCWWSLNENWCKVIW